MTKIYFQIEVEIFVFLESKKFFKISSYVKLYAALDETNRSTSTKFATDIICKPLKFHNNDF